MVASTELRIDPLSGRLAIVAAGRAARPHTVAADPVDGTAAPAATDDECPFCTGNESMTPPEVSRTGSGEPGTPGWRVRVVPNLYPIVGADGAGPGAEGAHEVVVLSPDHRASFDRLADHRACEVFRMLRDRVAVHLAHGLPYGLALINHKRAAGASIAHPHAQVVALGFVPPEVVAAGARAAHEQSDLLAVDRELAREHDTTLLDGEGVSAWLPYAAGSPFTARVAAADGGDRFDLASDAELDGVALLLRDTLAMMASALGDPPVNVTVNTASADHTGPRRWYVEITPRLSVVAGFEMATGVLVNTAPAEHAVQVLRSHMSPA